MKSKIVIAGGTGFLGHYLSEKLNKIGYSVYIISRQKNHINWSDNSKIMEALEDAEMVINLAGKSVNCRYNEVNKKAILSSRVDTTNIIGNAILKCKQAPLLWINSSTATIYRHAEDRPMTEVNGELGKGFSVEVGKRWEAAFFSFQLPNTRQIALRTSIVLGNSGGAFPPYKNLVRFGLGGKQGSGKQMLSWVHIEDFFQIILFLQKDKNLSGIFNVAAPNPVSNAVFMKTMRKEMSMPFGIPAPKFLLKLGAKLIGTETELLLKSRWVLPERLLENGYQFKFSQIESAIKDLI